MNYDVDETSLYPKFSKLLRNLFKCQYCGERRTLWGKQPDVIGVRFDVKGGLMLHLYLVEVKIINSLEAVYNLIGEMEARTASFCKYNAIFYSFHPYLGILETYRSRELRDYAEHRGVGIIRVEGDSLSIERRPIPMFSHRVLSGKDLRDQDWVKDYGEARILKKVMRIVDWQSWKSIFDLDITHSTSMAR
jgi:hypothetical protein